MSKIGHPRDRAKERSQGAQLSAKVKRQNQTEALEKTKKKTKKAAKPGSREGRHASPHPKSEAKERKAKERDLTPQERREGTKPDLHRTTLESGELLQSHLLSRDRASLMKTALLGRQPFSGALAACSAGR